MGRKAWGLAAAALGLILALGGTVESGPKKKEKLVAKEAPFTHVVLFTLKKDVNAEQVQTLIADSHEMLEKIPTVRSLKAGRPAEKGTPIASKEYQVGLLVNFDDSDGLKTYIDHEEHQGFVKKHEKEFEKVVIYDFVNQAK